MPCKSLTVDHFAVGSQALTVVSNDGQAFTGNMPVADSTHFSSQDSILSGDCN